MIIDLPKPPAIILTLEEIRKSDQIEKTNTTKNEHTVVAGETLTSISELHSVPVQRIWEKNLELTNPDLIEPNMVLILPDVAEVLTPRPFPAKIQVDARPADYRNSPPSGGFSSSGNTYTYGYCTWLVKNLRPDLPNNLGNASSWLTNASRQGLRMSDTPGVGSVAVTLGYSHVSYVIAVHESTVTVREMNYVGWNVISTRTAPISEFRYIL